LPLPEGPSRARIARYLLGQELRSLLLSPALWLLLAIVSILVGYSFIQAVALYSQASRTALSFPELAAGMNPLDGILVPTFGAYYLGETLLLPFVAIRLIGLDKESGALKLLLQLPLSPLSLCAIKLAAMGLLWLLTLLPAGLVLLFWHKMGGHLHLPETALLFAGHGLYSLVVVTIAMFAAAISDSLPTAAMISLAVTLGSWVLDFAVSGQGGTMALLGSFSLTSMLHRFETGLLATSHVAALLGLALFFFLLTTFWLRPGRTTLSRLGASLVLVGILASLLAGVLQTSSALDLSENRRHSLNPADSRALRHLEGTLTMTIHLDRRDSRLLDLEHGILARLRRAVPHLVVRYAATGATGLFGASEDPKYGLIEYTYEGRHDQSYSNSAEEILPIIYRLAGITVRAEPVPAYPGYPLVADAGPTGWWFYLVIPLLCLAAGLHGMLLNFYQTHR